MLRILLETLREQGKTQEANRAKLGLSRAQVSQYIMVLDSIATENLSLAKNNQMGRVAEKATTVAIDFTEWWFRELLKL